MINRPHLLIEQKAVTYGNNNNNKVYHNTLPHLPPKQERKNKARSQMF